MWSFSANTEALQKDVCELNRDDKLFEGSSSFCMFEADLRWEQEGQKSLQNALTTVLAYYSDIATDCSCMLVKHCNSTA